jgi:hypothetical protein
MSDYQCMVYLAVVDSVYDIWDIQAQAYDNLGHDRYFWEMMDFDIYYVDDDSRDVWRECSRVETYWNYYLSCWQDDDPDNQPHGFAYAEEGRAYFPAVQFTMHWWNNVSGAVTRASAEIWVRQRR